ncbi:MAG: hypothetical protein ABUJ92_00625 [Desulfobacterales bacterium]
MSEATSAEKHDKMKGKKNGLCNISICLSPLGVVWYNHGSMAYYCEICANRLNKDPFNKRVAMDMFGHDLCTREPE